MFVCYRKPGKVSNARRWNSKTNIIIYRRNIFRPWKNTNNKEYQSEVLKLVKYVALEAPVHQHDYKECEKKSE